MKQKGDNKQWDAKSRGGALGHLFFVKLIRLAGVRAAYVFLSLVVIYFIPFAPGATRAIWFYNRKILHYSFFKSLGKVYLHYYRFGQTLIDKVAITNGLSGEYRFEFEDYDRFLEVLDRGDGVIMIGAHVGAWEIGSSFFGAYGNKINVVMFDAEYEKIREVIERNKSVNYKVIAVNKDSLDSILTIKGILDNGEYVCFQGDRYVPGQKCIPVHFLGHEACFPAGPFLLASRLRKPVVFYYATREKGRCYRFHFSIIEDQVKEGRNAQTKIVEQYIQSLEEIIKNYPQQWFNFYKFWK